MAKKRRYKKYYYSEGLYVVNRQSGERKSMKRDKKRKALPPGKRISKSGKVYYEYRKNRTDLKSDYPKKGKVKGKKGSKSKKRR